MQVYNSKIDVLLAGHLVRDRFIVLVVINVLLLLKMRSWRSSINLTACT